MKKISLLAFLCVFCMGLSAAPRSWQQARMAISDKQALQHVFTANQKDGAPAFYVFNRGNEEGFVIISADDRAHTVLGYSDTGHWDENALPDNLRMWLDMYTREISYAAMLPEKEDFSNQPLKAAQKTFTPVAPICQTYWGQGDPYNLLCPQVSTDRCLTGCVATAAAQVMKVYNYPTQGTGSHSYKWETPNGDSIVLSADFGNTTYAWSKMPDSYVNSSGTTEQKNAVATLMYHCGVACDMDYGVSSSGANTARMVRSMVNYFGYDREICSLFKDYMDEEDLIDSIYADLLRNRPVMVSARTITDVGHAFICDGIDKDGLLHINWGWYGKSEGYFRVSAFDPDNQGEGGSLTNQAYTERIRFFTHIHPDNNGTYHYSITGDNIYTKKMRYGKEDKVVFRIDTIYNRSVSTYKGALVAQVYKDGVPYNRHTTDSTYLTLSPEHYYKYATLNTYFDDYPAGEYEVKVCARDEDSPEINIPVMRKWLGEWKCKMTITADSIWFEYPEITVPEPRPFPDPTTYSFTRLSAYYYPSYSSDTHHRWKLQLATPNFYSVTGGDDQMLLLFHVYGASPDAIIGSYPNDTALHFHCFGGSQYIGAGGSSSIKMKNPECCLVYNSSSNNYLFHYHVTINGKEYTGSATLSMSKIKSYYGEAYEEHSKNESITLNHQDYTSLSVTEAVSMIQSHEENWRSEIPYVVCGRISSVNNTPAEMLQYKNCRLHLSDETASIYAYNTRWLNNTYYTTGNEIQVGGKGTIVGKLYYYQGITPEIEKGYFCLYSDGEGIEITQAEDSSKVQKILRNGVLYIRREGAMYTLDGIKVND